MLADSKLCSTRTHTHTSLPYHTPTGSLDFRFLGNLQPLSPPCCTWLLAVTSYETKRGDMCLVPRPGFRARVWGPADAQEVGGMGKEPRSPKCWMNPESSVLCDPRRSPSWLPQAPHAVGSNRHRMECGVLAGAKGLGETWVPYLQ